MASILKEEMERSIMHVTEEKKRSSYLLSRKCKTRFGLLAQATRLSRLSAALCWEC